MTIEKCTKMIKCDVLGCKNLAVYSLSRQGAKPTHFCQDCSQQVYKALGSVLVPKSVEAPFKNQKKIKGRSL